MFIKKLNVKLNIIIQAKKLFVVSNQVKTDVSLERELILSYKKKSFQSFFKMIIHLKKKNVWMGKKKNQDKFFFKVFQPVKKKKKNLWQNTEEK